MIIEKSVLVKLFHNKSLQKKYLPDLLPVLFSDKTRRLIAFVMTELLKRNSEISAENVLIYLTDVKVKAFMKKYFISLPTKDEIYDELYDPSVNSSLDLFEEAYAELHNEAFAHFVEGLNKDFTYDLGYKDTAGILARARAIEKVHKIIFRSKYKNKNDQIGDTIKGLGISQYQRFSSPKLTGILGGFSKGFPCTVIGRPSHNKSTFFSTNESCWNIKHGILDRVDIISPEEPPSVFWRRVLAYELKIELYKLIQGLAVPSKEEVQKVRDTYEGKLFFHEIRTLQGIKEFVSSVKTDRIVIDHVNCVQYPRDDAYNGIINLVNFEKDWLADNRESVIINLSQVNTKEMKKKGRLFPCKEDAYNSTVLEQASREFLSIYYPHLDSIDKENQKLMVGKKIPMEKDIVQISIEKNSFGNLGIVNFKYHYDYGIFEDTKDDSTKKISNIIMPDLGLPELFQ